MKKRILLIALAIILALSCLVLSSCKPGNGGDTESSSEGESQSGQKPGPGPGGETVVSGDSSVPNVQYIRITELGDDSVTLKFNVYNAPSNMSYEIRTSDNEITEKNFDKATKVDAKISGSGEITAVLNGVIATPSEARYIAIVPSIGSEKGTMATARAGGNDPLRIDYNNSVTNVYHGESLRDFSKLFDEQAELGNRFYFPETNIGALYSGLNRDGTVDENSDDVKEGKVGMILRPIINLEYLHYVSTVSVYFDDRIEELSADKMTDVKVRWSIDEVSFDAEDSEWLGVKEIKVADIQSRKWNTFEIGEKARYVQVIFKDGAAPNEIAIYGYQEGVVDEIASTKRPLPTMNEMMGMCGFVAAGGGNTPVTSINCTTVLREYHNFGWSYNEKAYGSTASFFSGSMGNFDGQYKYYKEQGILVVPCVQWSGNIARQVDENGLPLPLITKYDSNGKAYQGFPEAGYFEKFDPAVYFLYADNMFSFAARYGSNKSQTVYKLLRAHCSTSAKEAGQGTLQWLEFGNEPNGEDSRGMVPYQLAALQSASYDGHERTMISKATGDEYDEETYHIGAKNADPNIKVAMAGLAGPGGRYITSMCHWLQANRSDGSIAMDAFNFHCYFSHTYQINGTTLQMGVSPEYYGIIDAIHGVIEYRDKYHPDVECWITEFGWDTNPSYETMTAAHAYAEYNAHQVQAMWLVRAYLLFSSCGIDKATMYMCEDVAYDVEAVGKYGTCGVIGFDKDGKEYKKDSYYYLYTLKNTLGDYRFNRELNSGRDDVWVFEYVNADGKLAYAVWCPTQDGTKVADFQLKVNGSSATLVEAVDLDIDGVSKSIPVSNGAVTIDVSENPVYVVMN